MKTHFVDFYYSNESILLLILSSLYKNLLFLFQKCSYFEVAALLKDIFNDVDDYLRLEIKAYKTPHQ